MQTTLSPEAVDCHLHAGLERRETLEDIFAYLREDGRKVVGLIDHAELYLEDPPDWAQMGLYGMALRAGEVGAADLFEDRLHGPLAFYMEAREAAARFGGGLRVGVGLEVSGPYLDRIEPEWLDGADYLGICADQPPEGRPWGEHMAGLVRRAERLRGGRDIGLVLHHPFRWRLLGLGHDAQAEIPDAGGFTREDAETASRALAEAGAVAEVNFASFWHLGRDRRLLPAARKAFELLRDAGASFSLGSDFHGVRGLPTGYAPSKALEAFGLSTGDVRLPKPFDTVRCASREGRSPPRRPSSPRNVGRKKPDPGSPLK